MSNDLMHRLLDLHENYFSVASALGCRVDATNGDVLDTPTAVQARAKSLATLEPLLPAYQDLQRRMCELAASNPDHPTDGVSSLVASIHEEDATE